MIDTRLGMKFILMVSAFIVAFNAASENQVRADLVADVQSVSPGKTFRAGVLFHLPEHAHIYWRNPGDSGLATGIEWQLSDGVKVSELHWPNPRRFEVEGLEDVNHGYEDEVLLYSDVTAPENASGHLTLELRAVWLLCLDDGECIPEKADLTMEIPIASERVLSDHAARFDVYAAHVPQEIAGPEFPVEVRTNEEAGELTVAATPPWEIIPLGDGEEANYFPDAGPAWQRLDPSPGGASARAVFRAAEEPMFSGVLTVPMRNARENKARTLFITVLE